MKYRVVKHKDWGYNIQVLRIIKINRSNLVRYIWEDCGGEFCELFEQEQNAMYDCEFKNSYGG